MDENQARLDRLKAEQRVKSKRQDQLRQLIEGSQANLDDKLAAFRTVMRADQARFSSAIAKMLNDKD